MPHFLVTAAHKSSGKTTISIGLSAALTARGQKVQTFKKGPDYIDPMWLGRAAGTACRNLDFYTQSNDEIIADYARAGRQADATIVEGSKGLYDGMDPTGSDSTAALARLLGLPVILVIDTQGITRGVAPLILGYQAFEPDIPVAGVILNKVASERHEGKLHAAVGHYTDVPVLGAVRRSKDLEIVERHIGLVPANEADDADKQVARIAGHVADDVDLDLLETVAGATPISLARQVGDWAPAISTTGARVRIGVCRDAAFGFYYAADLEALSEAGADLVPFDAIEDAHLPDVDGLFISGGFPETQMAALEANGSMRADIKAAIEDGMPVYAECGGLMYLARQINWRGEVREMVGALAADVVMTERPVGRGYVRLQETGLGPWPLQRDDDPTPEFPAHEFHYSRLENIDPALAFAYDVRRGTGSDGAHDGLIYKNLLASYAHLRDVEGNRWTQRFVGFVRDCRDQNMAGLRSGKK